MRPMGRAGFLQSGGDGVRAAERPDLECLPVSGLCISAEPTEVRPSPDTCGFAANPLRGPFCHVCMENWDLHLFY